MMSKHDGQLPLVTPPLVEYGSLLELLIAVEGAPRHHDTLHGVQ
jgi:hypothetical protein